MSEHINDEALNVDNRELIAAMDLFMKEQSRENLSGLMHAARSARFLVPARFAEELTSEQQESLHKSGKFPDGKTPDMQAILVQTEEKDLYMPAYTSRQDLEMNEDHYPIVLNIDFREVVRIASAETKNGHLVKGIMLNPYSSKLILRPEFAQTALRADDEQREKDRKEVRMTMDEFIVFARKNVETGLIPKAFMENVADFFEALSDQRGSYLLDFYRQPYGENMPCRYQESDFDVMILNVNPKTEVASIDLPTPEASGLASEMYLIRNPESNEGRCFLIENNGSDQPLLCEINSHYQRVECGNAPAGGSELYYILNLIKNSERE